jgi:hypothetical protein
MQSPDEQPDPTSILTGYGWSKSFKPNTYVPKPVTTWVDDSGSIVFVHRGAVDLSGCESPVGTDELRAFAALADAPEIAVEPVVTRTRVRILVWMHTPSRATCLDIEDDGLLGAMRQTPIELLKESGQFGVPEDPRPLYLRPGHRPGQWLWDGFATATSRGEGPDEISLFGEWHAMASTTLAEIPRGK